MRKNRGMTLSISIVLLLICLTQQASAATLYLSVTASMSDLFTEVADRFEKHTPTTRIVINTGSSGSLARQIVHGAPVDIYISANQYWMDHLVSQGLVDPGRRKIIARNELVFVGKPGHPIPGFEALSDLDRLAIGVPESVPAGQYAKQALVKAGLYQSLKRSNALIYAKDVRQALLYADRGEVDGAFVYRTDLAIARNAKLLFTVPEGFHQHISYPAAIISGRATNQNVLDFYHYLSSEEVSDLLAHAGFLPVQ